MVFLVAAEQCGEQFSALRADCHVELADYPVKMEREMSILTDFPIYPHLFRCLILTGNFSRGVSPPSDHSAESSSLPSGLACLPDDTTGDRERFTIRPRPAGPPRAIGGRKPSMGYGYAPPAVPRRCMAASGELLAWAGHRMPAGQAGHRADQGHCGTFADSRPASRCVPETLWNESERTG